MMMKINLLLISAVVFVFFSTCKKNNNSTTTTSKKTTDITSREGSYITSTGATGANNPSANSCTVNLPGKWFQIKSEKLVHNHWQLDYNVQSQIYLDLMTSASNDYKSGWDCEWKIPGCGVYETTWKAKDCSTLIIMGSEMTIDLITKDSLILSHNLNDSTRVVEYYSKNKNACQPQSIQEKMLVKTWILKTKIDYTANGTVQKTTNYINPKYNKLSFYNYWGCCDCGSGWVMTRIYGSWDTPWSADTTQNYLQRSYGYKILNNITLKICEDIYTIETLTNNKFVMRTSPDQNSYSRYFFE